MGALSINFTVANEMWLRQQTMNTWGNRSAIINRAVDYWRARKTSTPTDPAAMLGAIYNQLQGPKSAERPYGNLTEKENQRLFGVICMMRDCIAEFSPEVVE